MKDYFAILDLNHDATDEQIRTQYRQLVRIYHPDRFSNPVDKEYAERKLQEINEAYYGLLAPERTGKGVNRRLTQSENKFPILSTAPSSIMILLSVLFFGVLLGGLDYEALFSDDPSLGDRSLVQRLFGSWQSNADAAVEAELDHDWMSFSVFENYRNVLYVVNADGQPQIEFPIPGHLPVWSPNREQLAFLSSEREGTQIYVTSVVDAVTEAAAKAGDRTVRTQNSYRVASEELTRITQDPDSKEHVAWAPGGSMLAYIARERDSQESILKIVTVESGEIVSLTSARAGNVQSVTWLDDANLLAELVIDGKPQIYLIPVDGQAAAPFVNFSSRTPAVSPSGQRVVVANDEGVFTVLRNGTQVAQLTTAPAWEPIWSPTGRQIAYLAAPIPLEAGRNTVHNSDDSSTADTRTTDARTTDPRDFVRKALWVMDANGENSTQLMPAGILAHAWSVDGTEIAYITGNLQATQPTLYLWRTTLDGEQSLIAEISEPHISWGREP